MKNWVTNQNLSIITVGGGQLLMKGLVRDNDRRMIDDPDGASQIVRNRVLEAIGKKKFSSTSIDGVDKLFFRQK
jgi:hypothetical protein